MMIAHFHANLGAELIGRAIRIAAPAVYLEHADYSKTTMNWRASERRLPWNLPCLSMPIT